MILTIQIETSFTRSRKHVRNSTNVCLVDPLSVGECSPAGLQGPDKSRVAMGPLRAEILDLWIRNGPARDTGSTGPAGPIEVMRPAIDIGPTGPIGMIRPIASTSNVFWH